MIVSDEVTWHSEWAPRPNMTASSNAETLAVQLMNTATGSAPKSTNTIHNVRTNLRVNFLHIRIIHPYWSTHSVTITGYTGRQGGPIHWADWAALPRETLALIVPFFLLPHSWVGTERVFLMQISPLDLLAHCLHQRTGDACSLLHLNAQ